jgi:phenylacetate-coenzyme A ligase PaaK-like adenylate-forming protein
MTEKVPMGRYWDEELETAPWLDVQAWQAARLVDFVAALPGRCSLYREELDSFRVPTSRPGSLSFLADLPFTVKDDLRRSQEDAAPGSPFGRHQGVPLNRIVQAVSSSGTTGDPTYFALTASDLDVWRHSVAGVFHTAGVRSDDVVAHLVALPMVAGGLPYADAYRHLGATLAWLGGFPSERILRSLPRLQTSALMATASFLTYLVDHCADIVGFQAKDLGLRKLIGGGEPGLAEPEIREKILQGFGVDHLREVMGLGDVLACMWGECDEGSGMHFCAQRTVVVELVDPETGVQLPWEEGARGEAVYTTFTREATPTLRFRSADHVVVTGMGCACGRTSPKIHCVGRTDDMLIYKAMNVFPTAIREVVISRFSDVVEPTIRIWKERAEQVRFDNPIPLEVEARPELEPGGYPAVARRIEAELRTRLQVRADVAVMTPGALPRTSYKTPLVYVREQER